MAVWDDRHIDGQEYSFAHLRDFDMRLERPAKGTLAAMSVPIRVVFDCHVVTEEDDARSPGDVQGNPSYWIDAGGRCRHFHLDRYQRSLNLPSLIRGLPLGQTKCYFAKNSNYMVWRPEGAGRNGPHYQAFFEMRKVEQPIPRLVMHVKSAYLKNVPMTVQREREVVFGTLCAELMGLIPTKTSTNRHRRR